MADPIHVRLKKNWPGNFRRTVRKDGKPKLNDDGSTTVLEFTPGEVVTLTDEDEIASIQGDISITDENAPGGKVAKALELMPPPITKPDPIRPVENQETAKPAEVPAEPPVQVKSKKKGGAQAADQEADDPLKV